MRHYRLPIISGALIALIFYPFYVWPLALLALAPLYYFASASERSKKELFIGGFITGVLGIMPTIFFSLFQLRMIEHNEIFSYIVHASSLPILLSIACLFGLMSLLFVQLRTSSTFYNVCIGASLYVLLESVLFWFFGGYYLGSFGHAVVSLPQARALAAIGGVPLVVFVLAGLSATIAEILRASKVHRSTYVAICGTVLLVVATVGYSYQAYLKTPAQKTLSVSIIQIPYANKNNLPYGHMEKGVFVNPIVEESIRDASKGSDLVLYPYTPFQGMTYKGTNMPTSTMYAYVPDEALGAWLQHIVPTSTTVLLWNTVADTGGLYDEYALWKNGIESEYRKRHLYPLSDYAPWWADIIHVHAFLFSIKPGEQDNRPIVNGEGVGGLVCSELHQVELARREAVRSPFIIAVGSDTMFPGDLMGTFSLAAARYRAAENNIPVIRGNINGPSAVIAADGSIAATLRYATPGVLRGTVGINTTHPKTVFSIWGDVPVRVMAVLLLCIAAYRRIDRTRSLGRKARD